MPSPTSSSRGVDNPSWLFWVGAATSFAGGVGVATYLLRLRDRERLRRACSRTMKHLVATQRRALGPVVTEVSALVERKKTSDNKVVVVGAGSYGTAMAYTAAVNGSE